jgi:hypothetical protein
MHSEGSFEMAVFFSKRNMCSLTFTKTTLSKAFFLNKHFQKLLDGYLVNLPTSSNVDLNLSYIIKDTCFQCSYEVMI